MTTATARTLTVNGRLGTTIIGNGIQVSYLVALVNIVLQLVVSFGVDLTAQQEGLIISLVNVCLLIGARAVVLAHRELEVRGKDPGPK